MADVVLPLPRPRLDGPYQPGITDPVWPATAPPGVDPATYQSRYAGQLERQRHLHVVTANLATASRAVAREAFEQISRMCRIQMEKKPPKDVQRPYDPAVVTRRVSVTVGVGATLFTTVSGDDRFGIAGLRPAGLKIMPSTEGDDPAFRPAEHATDLVFLIASDDVYVNEYIFGLLYYHKVHKAIDVRRVERGYARPDNREPSGFEDGLSNPRAGDADSPMHRFVYVRDGDEEPGWCTAGTYLAFRKIRRRMKRFFALPDNAARESVFGVERLTGERLAHPAHEAHAIKMNPRRPDPDFLGVRDDTRHFLRRPYFFDDGLDASGEESRGLHHLSFARNLLAQYEWPVQMWQMNPDFPEPGTGLDALYRPEGGAANVGGGYYFMPRAAGRDGYFARELFD
jgi:deferrochelatase/peroxidase EfeB